MMLSIAITLVALAGAFLVALGLAALLRPARARNFLLGFAGTAAKHYAELAVRLAVGGALVLASPALPAAKAFYVFGWVLLASTGVMLLIPWRMHRAFAQASVPRALRFLPAIGLASVAAGAGALWAVLAAVAA